MCVAACVMWVRSYFASDEIIWRTEQIDRRDGKVWNVRTTGLRSSDGWWAHHDFSDVGSPDTLPPPLQEKQGHSYDRTTTSYWSSGKPLHITFVATRFGGQTPVPYWLTALMLAILPAWRGAALVIRRTQDRRRQDRIGRCRACGYDLRATPGRCPECGAQPTGASS